MLLREYLKTMDHLCHYNYWRTKAHYIIKMRVCNREIKKARNCLEKKNPFRFEIKAASSSSRFRCHAAASSFDFRRDRNSRGDCRFSDFRLSQRSSSALSYINALLPSSVASLKHSSPSPKLQPKLITAVSMVLLFIKSTVSI